MVFPFVSLCIYWGLISCNRISIDEDNFLGETWTVASKTTSINNQEYLFVKKEDSLVWELIRNEIVGFDYQAGKEYSIIVKTNGSKDGVFNKNYSLLKVLSVKVKESEYVPLFNEGQKQGDDVYELIYDNNSSVNKLGEDIIIVQGDMVLNRSQVENSQDTKSFFLKTKTMYWPNNTVYYTYGSGFTQYSKVTTAIDEWENKTSLSFVYGTGSGNYIEFINDTWNHSYVGMMGGKQELGLTSSSTAGTAMHEIGHAVGLQHEHCRYDRTNKIIVYSANADPNYQYAFNTLPSSTNATIGVLDFSSLMMYGSYAFSINGLPTMKTPEGATWTAQRSYLSPLDVDGVAAIYGPPYHHLEADAYIIQDYVSGIDEVHESDVTYSIQIYSNKQFTQSATLKYARPITVNRTHYYYDSVTNQMHQDNTTLYITIPANASYYILGSSHNIERYQMSNPIEVDVTYYSLVAPSSTMYN